jgi:hypothetical protein
VRPGRVSFADGETPRLGTIAARAEALPRRVLGSQVWRPSVPEGAGVGPGVLGTKREALQQRYGVCGEWIGRGITGQSTGAKP